MIAKIAVSAANFAIDKPYSYLVPDGMELLPGQRVQLPFGRGNTRCEGVVLSVEEGTGSGISAPFTMPSGPCSRRDSGFKQKPAML